LPKKYEIDKNKECTLEDYKVVVPVDKFFDIIKQIHLPDHCKARTLRARVVDKHGISILTWI